MEIVRTRQAIRTGGNSRVTHDYPKTPVGGRLFRFRTAWKGAHYESVVKQGLSWTWNETLPPPEIIEQESSPEMDGMLVKLRRKRVIEEAKILRWQSRLFTVPKKDSTEDRLIIDLSILNGYIKSETFKMLTLQEVKQLLPKGYWTVSIDLKDGFWHVPVTRKKRPFLGFRWKNKNWQFRAMPFGLNVAPRAFTKVIAHVVRVMAESGIWCLPYLDDLLIIASTEDECQQKADQAVKILESLGWLLNWEKSRLTPAQRFIWLGVQFDLCTHTAMTPIEKMDSFQQLLKQVLVADFSSVREIMKLQGVANWVGQHDPIVKLMLYRTRKIIRAFKKVRLDTPITLSRGMKLSLCKWVTDSRIPQSLGVPSPDIMVQTDASLRGWGFQIDNSRFSGKFDRTMSYNINILEMLTIWYSLLVIRRRGISIQIMCDNSSAIAAVRRGSSRVPHLAVLSELIWRRAASFQWTLSVSHIQGAFNVLADQLSRGKEVTSEWSLPKKDFQKIQSRCPQLQVDLFATSLNNKLQTFISPCPDKRAAAVDALSTPWDSWDHLYLFPPTKLISRALAKLTTSTFKSAVLVTQDYPTRPWYMALKIRKVPSTLMEVHLQQVVVDTLVTKPQVTRLRVWQLSSHHTRKGFQTVDRTTQ